MECSFGECWLERPILAFQQLCKNKTIQSKDIKKKFLKAMKNVQKQKKTKREDFKNNLSLYLSQCSESSSLEMDTNKTERNEALGSVVVKTLKKQFKHPAHCVANLLKDFFDIFACYYHSICTKNKQITKIYDQTVKFCNGEVSDMQDEINNTNYDLTISKEIRTQIEHSFIEIKSVLNIIIDTVPLFYSGLISKYSFILIKDELLNYFMSEYMGDKTYQLLFTF